MRRIGLAVVLAFSVALAPLAATAQPPTKVARIGCLWSGSASAFSSRLQAFREGLRELGYREGQTVAIECRFADGGFERLPALAAQIINLKPDVIVTAGDPSIRAARQATKVIPIVVANAGDLVGPGHVASLARPGGNITGLVDMSPELSAKRLQLVKEAIPKTTRVAILWNPTNPAPYDLSLWALRTWLDSWSGIGHVAVGMHRQGFGLQLTEYDNRGWPWTHR